MNCKPFPLTNRATVLLAGVLLTLGFAPFHLWPLALVGLALFIRLSAAAPTATAAFKGALWFGLAHGVTALYWLPWAFYHDSNSMAFALLGGIPASLGLALWVGVGYALAAAAAWRWRHSLWGYPLALGGMLLCLEILRMLTPVGFPWLPLGAVWVGGHTGAPTLAQLAAWGGVPLLSLLALALAFLLARLTRSAWLGAALLLGIMASFGAWRTMGAIPATNTVAATVPIIVRVVQPNLGAHKWDPVLRWQFLEETLFAATAPLAHGAFMAHPPQMVVLPETGVPFVLNQTPEVIATLATAFPSPTLLLTGSIRREDTPQGQRYYNSLQALYNGQIIATTDKQLLVPFGEFIPLRGLLEALPLPITLRVMSQARTDFTHGSQSPRLVTPYGTLVGLICYEGIFPFFVVRHAQGAQALINITNDAWFTGTSALYQHAALQRLRAIETGVPLLRSANTGISMVVDGHGRMLRHLGANHSGVLDIALPQALPPTAWMQLWAWFLK